MINRELLEGCNKELIEVMTGLDNECQDKGFQIIVSSGYRDPARNALVGGAPKSDHMNGNAVDFYFSDAPIMFAHVTELYQRVIAGKGLWGNITKMEIVRDIANKDTPQAGWANHCHLTIMPEPRKVAPIFFTGAYQ